MSIVEFEEFIKKTRMEFRDLIEGYLNEEIGIMKEMLKKKINECHSVYEEDTLKEHLKEEFDLYLENLKGE